MKSFATASRTIIRRAPIVSQVWNNAPAAAIKAIPTTSAYRSASVNSIRCFSSNAPTPTENIDHVRKAIESMLMNRGQADHDVKPITDEELEYSLSYFAKLFEEARACINDCKEVKAGSLEFYEELYTAQRAVDQAFNSYVDLLDDFRRASDEQLKLLCQDRLALANELRALRQECHLLGERKQNVA